MRMRHRDSDHDYPAAESILFPTDPTKLPLSRRPSGHAFDLTALPESADLVREAMDHMSRRIDHLARELRCLGYFDDDDDSPRAA